MTLALLQVLAQQPIDFVGERQRVVGVLVSPDLQLRRGRHRKSSTFPGVHKTATGVEAG